MSAEEDKISEEIGAICIEVTQMLERRNPTGAVALSALLGLVEALCTEAGMDSAEIFAGALFVACGEDIEKARSALDTERGLVLAGRLAREHFAGRALPPRSLS